MNKDKDPMPRDGDGLPPPSSRAAGAPPKSSTPPLEYISRMPDFPTRNTGHRRAHSEILSLPDDLDLSAPGGGDGPSLSDENDEELFSMFLDVEKLNSSCGTLLEAKAESSSAGGGRGEGVGLGQATRPRHQHSQSMDESMSIEAEELVGAPGTEGMSPAEAKKAVSAAKLAELALVDPKRAKRSVSHCCSRLLVTFLLLYKLLHAVWLAWFIFETGLVNSILLNRSSRTKWLHL
jgi:hypothetical protein